MEYNITNASKNDIDYLKKQNYLTFLLLHIIYQKKKLKK